MHRHLCYSNAKKICSASYSIICCPRKAWKRDQHYIAADRQNDHRGSRHHCWSNSELQAIRCVGKNWCADEEPVWVDLPVFQAWNTSPQKNKSCAVRVHWSNSDNSADQHILLLLAWIQLSASIRSHILFVLHGRVDTSLVLALRHFAYWLRVLGLSSNLRRVQV